MKASQAIIMYDDEGNDISYAEHFDIINGNLVNAKPVKDDFFSLLAINNNTELQKIPKEVVALSNNEIVFIVPTEVREIKLALDNTTIYGNLLIPNLVFHVNKITKNIYVYEYENNKLYNAPFPNITNGKLCIGTVSDELFSDNYQETISKVKNVFFDSRFSNHYDSEMFNNIRVAIETFKTEYYDKTKRTEISSNIQRFIVGLL